MAGKNKVIVMGQLADSLENTLARDHQALFLRRPEELERQMPWEDVEVVVIRSPFRLTREMISRCPRLGMVVRAGVGTDHIDLEALTVRNIAFHICPGATNAVAELVIGGILALFRDFAGHRTALAAGVSDKFEARGRELAGAALGIVGFGRIGERVAELAGVFGASCIAIERDHELDRKRARAARLGVPLTTDFAGALGGLDVLVLACPLTDRTQRMLDADALRMLPPSAVVVNVGRGGLWDQDAVLAAIERNEISGAICDVYEREPPPRGAFFDHPRVIATPHVGAQTVSAHERIARQVELLLRSHFQPSAVTYVGGLR